MATHHDRLDPATPPSRPAQAVHVTRRGQRFSIDPERYEALRAAAAPLPHPRRGAGMALPVLLAAAALAGQYLLAGAGLVPSPDTAARWGLSAVSLRESWWPLLGHPFLHADLVSLAVHAALLLFFGIPLGRRFGPWMVGFVFAAGAVFGGLAALAAALAAGGAVHLGMGPAAFAVMAAAVLLDPRGTGGSGFFPWRLLAAVAALGIVPALTSGLFSGGEVSFAGPIAGSAAGALLAVFVVEARFRDLFRVGAFALVIAIFATTRLWLNIAGLATALSGGLSGLASAGAGPWLRLPLDLFLLVIAAIYLMSQAEQVRDRLRWDHEDRLDALVDAATVQLGVGRRR